MSLPSQDSSLPIALPKWLSSRSAVKKLSERESKQLVPVALMLCLVTHGGSAQALRKTCRALLSRVYIGHREQLRQISLEEDESKLLKAVCDMLEVKSDRYLLNDGPPHAQPGEDAQRLDDT